MPSHDKYSHAAYDMVFGEFMVLPPIRTWGYQFFEVDYHALEMYVLAFPFHDFPKFGFLQSFLSKLKFQQL